MATAHGRTIRHWAATLAVAIVSSCSGGTDNEAEQKLNAALESDPVLQQYLVVQDALAKNRLDEALAALRLLSDSADEEVQQLAAAEQGADIDSVRVLFRSISENLIAHRQLAEGLAVASCPMAFDYQGARWIQRTGELANPYFGTRMLHCGIFEQTGTQE